MSGTISKAKAFSKAYKPFDIVTNRNGDVGYIQEANVNDCSSDDDGNTIYYIQYSVNWLIGYDKNAWFKYDELTMHCNLFVKMAEVGCCTTADEKNVQYLFNAMNRDKNNIEIL